MPAGIAMTGSFTSETSALITVRYFKKCILLLAGVLPFLMCLHAGYAHAGDKQIADNIDLLTDRVYYKSLMEDLGQAKRSIIIIMYLFKATGYKSALPDHIVDMILEKHRQGVPVTVLLNIDRSRKSYGGTDDLDKANISVARRLEERGVKVYFDSPRRITHAKVVIIDKRIVYIGSHNFTQSALKYNHEVSVRVVSPAFAEELVRYMEELRQER